MEGAREKDLWITINGRAGIQGLDRRDGRIASRWDYVSMEG